jgi:dGTPase
MINRFYTTFDSETLGAERKTDYRNAFQIDRDRLIHAHAFRKLQSKTQVFLSGEYDFYRTRLTHSIEVAQIGRSICHFLRTEGGVMRDDFYIDSDLVEARVPGARSRASAVRPLGRADTAGTDAAVGRLRGQRPDPASPHGTMYQHEAGVHGMTADPRVA